MKLKAAVLGASGYSGAELLRLLSTHPKVTVTCPVAHSYAGKEIVELYPQLRSYAGVHFTDLSAQAELSECVVIFSALPHMEGAALLPTLKNRLIIDLSGDFRLLEAELYQRWYQKAHPAPHELGRWVYGLCELKREQIREAARIANPGCYATAVILAAAPLIKQKLVRGPLAVVAASGVSGAGRSPSATAQFSQASEDLRAYKVCEHQHTPEIEQALGEIGCAKITVSLTTELAPFSRGILAVVSAELCEGVDQESVDSAFTALYGAEPFVQVSGKQPGVKDVRGSNWSILCPRVDQRCGRVVVTSVLDNLVKGAAGQAVQNMNLALGFEENLGLEALPLYP